MNTVTMSDSLSLSGSELPIPLFAAEESTVIMDYGHLGGCPLQSPMAMPGSKVLTVIKTINTLVGRRQVSSARYRQFRPLIVIP